MHLQIVAWVLVTIVQTLPVWHRLSFFQLEGKHHAVRALTMGKYQCVRDNLTLAHAGDGGDKLWLAAQAATGGAIWTFAIYWAGVLMPATICHSVPPCSGVSCTQRCA